MENSNRVRAPPIISFRQGTTTHVLHPPLIPHFCGFVPPCCSPSQGARRARSASPTVVPPIDTLEAPHERETPGSDPRPRRRRHHRRGLRDAASRRRGGPPACPAGRRG